MIYRTATDELWLLGTRVDPPLGFDYVLSWNYLRLNEGVNYYFCKFILVFISLVFLSERLLFIELGGGEVDFSKRIPYGVIS